MTDGGWKLADRKYVKDKEWRRGRYVGSLKMQWPVSLEYLPYVRQIVEAEDGQEMKERARAGRTTRNSTRSQYVRMVELTDKHEMGWK
jgi:hypothetical protein